VSLAIGLLAVACGGEEIPIPAVAIGAADYSFALPDSIPGGLTRLQLTNNGKEEHHAQIFRLNDGVTLPQFQGAFQGIFQAPPERQGEATGRALALISLAGGPGTAVPGGKSEAVVDLKAGQHVLVCFVESPDRAPHVAKGMLKTLTVTAAPAKQPALPQAKATVSLNDFAFTGLPSLSSGKVTLQVTNNGKQPHEMPVVRLKGITGAQLKQILSAPPTPGQAPPPGPPPFEGAGGLQAISPGATAWTTLDLTPGEYALVCFVPDPASGKPHVALGMISTFTVK
jgi:hypothetical protein